MLSCALIGYGYWGKNVFAAIKSSSLFNLVGIYDSNKEALKDVDYKIFNSYKEVLDSSIEAVFIITPPHTHFELARLALNANKHIFVEKPLCMSVKESEALYNLAESKSKILHCDHIFTHSNALTYLKENLNSFGNILNINARRINLGLFRENVDVIWDLAIHDLSIIDYLFGLEISSFHTLKTQYKGFNATADIHLSLKNNINANISVSWLSPIKVREIIITGEFKTAIYDETKQDKITIFDCNVLIEENLNNENQIKYNLGEASYPKLDSTNALDNSIKAFFESIKKGENLSSREHILRVMRGLELICKE